MIKEVPTFKVEVMEDVVDKLRHVLAQAERGEVVGVGIAYTFQDGSIGTTFSKSINHGVLLGAMTNLQYRYAKVHNEE